MVESVSVGYVLWHTTRDRRSCWATACGCDDCLYCTHDRKYAMSTYHIVIALATCALLTFFLFQIVQDYVRVRRRLKRINRESNQVLTNRLEREPLNKDGDIG